MEKIIIGLVGQIASGKGTVANYLEKNHQATTYKFSTMFRDILKRAHQEITRENMQGLSTVMRNQFGEDLLAKVMAEDVKNDRGQVIVVDGIRRMADIKYLKELENFKLVAITAKPEIRYERLLKRKENAGDDQKTYEQFLTDQNNEADAEIPVVMATSTAELNNDGDLQELHKQIEKIINHS